LNKEDYLARVKGSQANKVNFVEFATADWNPNIRPPDNKRGRPSLYAMIQLETADGVGAFNLREVEDEEEGDDPFGDALGGAPERTRERAPAPRRPRKPTGRGRDADDEREMEAARYLDGLERFKRLAGRRGQGGAVRGQRRGPDSRDAGPARGEEAEIPTGPLELGQGNYAEGKRWIVITGLIPFAKQQREFFDRLMVRTSNVQEQDYVMFAGMDVERAEVLPEGLGEWVSLSMDAVAKEMEGWAEQLPEIVDERVLANGLCSTLPPLIDREWEYRNVVHSTLDKFRLQDEEVIEQAQNILQDQPEDNPAGPGAQRGRFLFRDALGSEYRDQQRNRQFAQQQLEAVDDRTHEHRMFRFFDFTVEPGKSYVYRVRLTVRNPNYRMPAKLLNSPLLSAEEFLDGPWSEPSQAHEVPKNSYLLAGKAKPPLTAKDGLVTVMINQWNDRQGVNAASPFDIVRGQIADFQDVTTVISIPGTEEAHQRRMNFTTGMLLVDYMGGAKIRARGRAIEP
ncbi:MAG: hypothetical protein N2C14_16480, partial [Planctomycetales bacterium]